LFYLLERGGKLPIGKRAFLEAILPDYQTALTASSAGEDKIDALATAPELVGAAVMAVTDLHPAGKAKTAAGKLLDVVSAGEFIAKDTALKIGTVEGGRIVVERA
jgi:membrane-bound ClpP family serine protease